MTDFLDRLASSMLGEAPSAQPLIAPRFAPGAEILTADTPMAEAPQAAPALPDYEQSLDTFRANAPAVTASQPTEERHSPDLQRRERERPRMEHGPKGPQALADEADLRKKPAQGPQLEPADTVPLATHGIEHDGTPDAPRRDLETEKVSASAPASRGEPHLQKGATPPPVRPAAPRPEGHQISPPAAREQSVEVESSHSRGRAHPHMTPVVREAGKTLPAKEMHEVGQLSDSIGLESWSAHDPSNVDSRENAQDNLAMPSGDGPVRLVARPPSLRAPDLRAVDDWMSDEVGARHHERSVERQQRPSREATFSPTEAEISGGAVQVQDASRTARIVRPERISALQQADSTRRGPASAQAPGLHAAPTIKVTIGRIEVRAVVPLPSQPQETARPAPKLSLDEYLKSLKGQR